MTQPTGKPRGRPKGIPHVVLMARLPLPLAEAVKRYATQQRLTVSDVIRDRLLPLMQEPTHKSPMMSYEKIDILSDGKGEIASGSKVDVAYDVNGDIASDTKGDILSDEKGDILSDGKEDIASDSKGDITYDRNGDIVSDGKEDIASYGKGDIVSDSNGGIASDGEAAPAHPAFDTLKYALGKLCPRAHGYQETGQSLLRVSNRHCVACDREKQREKRQAQHATV